MQISALKELSTDENRVSLTPDSINPKSEIKLSAAIARMKSVIPMPIGPDECRNGTLHGVKNIRKMLIYRFLQGSHTMLDTNLDNFFIACCLCGYFSNYQPFQYLELR